MPDKTQVCRKKPDPVKDREVERNLTRIATRGVVQLFNAVKQYQSSKDTVGKSSKDLKRKRSSLKEKLDSSTIPKSSESQNGSPFDMEQLSFLKSSGPRKPTKRRRDAPKMSGKSAEIEDEDSE